MINFVGGDFVEVVVMVERTFFVVFWLVVVVMVIQGVHVLLMLWTHVVMVMNS